MRAYSGSRPALEAFLAEAPESQLTIWAGAPGGEPGRYDRVAVLVEDRLELRAFPVSGGVRTAALAIWMDEAAAAISLTPRPEWPALQVIRSRAVDGGWLCILRFAAPLPVHVVVGELARQSVWPDRVGQRGIVIHEFGENERRDVPADVVVADWQTTWGEGEPPVTGRHPYAVTRDNRPMGVGPYDERVLNPTGFLTKAESPVVPLSEALASKVGMESLVRTMRPHRAVRVDADGLPEDVVAGVAGALAMAGVPLVAETLPASVVALLGPAVAEAITTPVDLADDLAREEHSIVLRRAAFDHLSTVAWRRRLGEITGVRVHHQAAVSVVMATRRPDMLAHALGQIGRQRGVESLELILAPHGFEADAGEVADLLGGLPFQIVPAASEALFGEVLNAAADAAGGDVVLKMDDDDFYSPDFVGDLLRARDYSGAELVGTPDDWYYLEERDLTLRLDQPNEVYRQFVAGGTMLVERQMLREVGGFRSVRRHVDAQLIGAIRDAGGTTYRTHGLGYCLRRVATGHTWETDLDALIERASRTWPGLRLSRLMES